MKLLCAIILMAFLLLENGSSPIPYTATAYSLRGRTASGHLVQRGIVAADTRIHPLGTKIRIHNGKYGGIYTVRDRGSKIKGRRIDIWMPSTREAKQFGKRKVDVSVVKS